MKKTLLLIAMLAPLAGFGKQLSPLEALQRIPTASGKHDIKALRGTLTPSPIFTVTANGGFKGAYIFDAGADSEGFIIVSADDCAAPLLGYSDSGSFDVNNVPPQLKNWLDFYARQIEWASRNGVKYASTSTASDDFAPIAPLTKTEWDQGAPYNDDCPLDNGKRSVTGCVATAMAQAMYYHQWPKQGVGSHSYQWNSQELTVDFANTTYDWSAMTLTYNDKSSAEAKAAVANLMYSCGVSVDMNYTSDESGASSESMGSALYKYFNYDKSMAFPQRSYYGTADWERMVYDQLSQGLPVLYGGQSGEGGHQFICDGYSSDGYFHFNWGWSGMSDGYYLLSALDPLEQGIGGSSSGAGFNYDQGILINMKPAQADSKVTPLIYCYGNFGVKNASDTFQLGKDVDFNGDYYNFACVEISGQMGVKLVDASGNVRYLSHGSDYSYEAFYGYADYAIRLPEDLADGTYTVTPSFLPTGETEWVDVLCPLSGVQALTMTVSDGEATFADDISNALEVSDFNVATAVYLGENFKTTFTLTNTGTTEYFGELVMQLLDSEGNVVAPANDIVSVDLQPGESMPLSYGAAFPEEVESDSQTEAIPAGTYYMALYTHFTHRQLYVDSNPIDVQTAPTQTELGVTALTATPSTTDPRDVTFNGTVACEEGYYAGRLKIAVFKENASETSLSADTDYVFVGSGETSSFTAHVTVPEDQGTSFFAVVYVESTQISNQYPFTLEVADAVTAISDSAAPTPVYNLEGVKVADSPASLAPGIYIIAGQKVLIGEF